MWIERFDKKASFIKQLTGLDRQVLIVTGARQVGKTSFISKSLEDLKAHPQIRLNLLHPSSFRLNGIDYFGQDFFGDAPEGTTFLKNLELELGPFQKLPRPAVIFIDEADRYPLALESVQALAEFSDNLKFVLTGSNLENVQVKNAATGRKRHFDLYPISFQEFLKAKGESKLMNYLNTLSPKDNIPSDFYHKKAAECLQVYLRLGGLPKLLDTTLDPAPSSQPIPDLIKDLALTIEENIKTILGEKTSLYAYEDVLRKLAALSINTLKYSRLQVRHASRYEAKKLVMKTVGGRVAHKIRLLDAGTDLSKYILFDTGLANYLLNGSDLLKTGISEANMAILLETLAGNELIRRLVTRDDLFYWKSGNQAELEFLIRSPRFAGIDVKKGRGDNKSLNSFALMEKEAQCLVKIHDGPLRYEKNYEASLPNFPARRKLPLLKIPHYLTGRLFELLGEA